MTETIKTISVLELAKRLYQHWPIIFDVRESWEIDKACLQQPYHHIPLGVLMTLTTDDMKDLATFDQEIVVICHHGKRSYHACLFLQNLGYQDLVNVTGGINAWSCQVDASVMRY